MGVDVRAGRRGRGSWQGRVGGELPWCRTWTWRSRQPEAMKGSWSIEEACGKAVQQWKPETLTTPLPAFCDDILPNKNCSPLRRITPASAYTL